MGNQNRGNSPKVPKSMQSDGLDVEYSRELADKDDLEAQARADAADARAKKQ